MTQTDIDARDTLTEIVSYGTTLAQHSRTSHQREWIGLEGFGCWLHPGEFLLEYKGKRHIVGLRDL